MNSQSVKNVQATLTGNRIESAASSLDRFAIAFEDGSGLLLRAVEEDGEFAIACELVEDKQSLPALAEAVCTVDWQWIAGSRVDSIEPGVEAVKFSLDPAGSLSVGLGSWEGKPFLSFRPYQPARL
ncbi:hypothetical protein GC174_11265 [bacterium]|nr:hypothetical protein [bacterium]